MILIDTSAWVDFFRGRGSLAEAVDQALLDGEAAVCGPVITEIRRGLVGAGRARVLSLLSGCHLLSEPDNLWVEAGDLGALLGRRGLTVKTLDLLIAACALAHGVPVLTRDGDFKAISAAGVGLQLA